MTSSVLFRVILSSLLVLCLLAQSGMDLMDGSFSNTRLAEHLLRLASIVLVVLLAYYSLGPSREKIPGPRE